VGLFRTLVIGLFIIAVPVALITTTIRVAISEQSVYDYSVRHYDAERTTGVPESELIRANGEIRDYVNGGDAPLSITVTNLGGEQERLFTPRETAHMADVRDLVGAMFTVQVAAVAIVLTLAVVMIALWPPRALVAASLYGGVLTALVLGSVGVLAVSGFDSAWSQFHGIAFSNDLWKLDPDTDHLIQMYPEAFWQRITLLLGVVILLQALLISAVSSAYLLLSRPVQDEPIERPRPEIPGAPGHGRPRIARPNPRHFVR
jgi:integral membrane protein (TIGR01906 family)